MSNHRIGKSLRLSLLLTMLLLFTFFNFAASGQSQTIQISKKRFFLSNHTPVRLTTAGWGAIQNWTEKNLIQQAFLKAGNAEADDNFGHAVAISGDIMVVGAPYEDSQGAQGDNNDAENAGMAYVFVRNDGIWEQNSTLKPSNSEAGDWFGWDVAIGDNRIVVAAPFKEDGEGLVYVFVKEFDGWKEQAILKALIPSSNSFFGTAVSIYGDQIIIGASFEDASDIDDNSGAAYVFGWTGTQWELESRLSPSFDQPSTAFFGQSVALYSSTIAVGAPGEDSSIADSGAVYLFQKSGSTWSQSAHLKASTPGISDGFGSSVSMEESTMVIGAAYHSQSSNPSRSGAAYVFVREEGAWVQSSLIKPSNPDSDDRFGSSVAISGNRIVVGAFFEDGSATVVGGEDDNKANDAGAAYAFVNTDDNWVQQSYLKASNSEEGDRFGWSVAISDGTTVVGAPYEDSGEGGVYVFYGQPPRITSKNSTTFTVEEEGSFAIEATGYPTPTILYSGDLPVGVSFSDHGNGSGLLEGIPTSGAAGFYELTITASNDVLPDAMQRFTVTVQLKEVILFLPLILR